MHSYIHTYIHSYIHTLHFITLHSMDFHCIPWPSIPFHYIHAYMRQWGWHNRKNTLQETRGWIKRTDASCFESSNQTIKNYQYQSLTVYMIWFEMTINLISMAINPWISAQTHGIFWYLWSQPGRGSKKNSRSSIALEWNILLKWLVGGLNPSEKY